MSEYIVTGRTGQNHVTSADHGAMNASFAGSGRYVAEGIGDTLSAEVVTNNLVRIHSGEVFNQGRHMRVEANTYVDCTVENGSQSKLRYDLIVFRYTKNADTGVENGEIVVIKGTAGTSAADPSYTTGNILAGALQDDMPLYRVRIEGINIVGLDKLFITVPGLAALNAKVSQLNSELSNTALSVTNIGNDLSKKILPAIGFESDIYSTIGNIRYFRAETIGRWWYCNANNGTAELPIGEVWGFGLQLKYSVLKIVIFISGTSGHIYHSVANGDTFGEWFKH